MTGERAHADEDDPLGIDLVRSDDGAPVAAAQVVVERRVGGEWQGFGDAVTDEAGHAELAATLRRTPADNVFRASYAGDSCTRDP